MAVSERGVRDSLGVSKRVTKSKNRMFKNNYTYAGRLVPPCHDAVNVARGLKLYFELLRLTQLTMNLRFLQTSYGAVGHGNSAVCNGETRA
jgi:hypothetical protein